MQHIQAIDPADATGEAKALLDGVKAAVGVVPNIYATLVQSPSVLEGFLALNAALARGALSAKLREQIALTVAGANACDYCASAHTALGRRAGLDGEELARNLRGRSADDRIQSALTFVREVVTRRGRIGDTDVRALREAGYGDAEIVEIVAHIGVNLFTNYFNLVAGTEVDFPLVRTGPQAAAA